MAAFMISTEDEKRVKALGFLRNRGTDCFSARILTTNGKITADQTACLAEAARRFGNGSVTFTSRLTVEIPGIPYDQIEAFRAYIATVGLATGGTGAKVRPVVSCKGTVCKFGLIDTFDLSARIHSRFYEGYREIKLPHKFKIAVGGCPNSCVKPSLNDLGVVGQRRPVYDKAKCKGCKICAVETVCPVEAAVVRQGKLHIDQTCVNCGLCVGGCPFGAIASGIDGYQLYIGGRWGKKTALGKPFGSMLVDVTAVLDTIESAILFYKNEGEKGERFAQTIERIGFENVERMILA